MELRDKFVDIFKKHWGAILTALLMSFLVSAPVILFPLFAGSEYKGIDLAHFGTDEYYYLSRGKEVLEGHNLGQPILKEGKDLQDPTFTYAEKLSLLPFKMLGIGEKVNIATIYNIYNFVGVFILILLVYALVLLMGGNRLLGIAAAIFMVGGYSIIYNKGLFFDDFNAYGRSIYPYMSSVPFFGFLIALYQSLKTGKKVLIIVSGLLFGLLFYVYLYAWTFGLSVLGALFLIYIFKKDWRNLKTVTAIAIAGIFIGSFIIFGLAKFFTSPMGEQLSYFYHSVLSHQFIMSKVGLATLILFVIFSYKKTADQNRLFILSIIIAGWVALNQQIITGKLIQYGHYYWYFVVPLSIIVGIYIIWSLLPTNKLKNYFLWLLIVIAFINTAVGQYQSYLRDLPTRFYEQKYVPFLALLKNEPPTVVLTADDSDGYPFLINIFTDHDLFWQSAAATHAVSPERIKDALFVNMFLNKKARNDFSGYLIRAFDHPNQESALDLNIYQLIEGLASGFDSIKYQKLSNDRDPKILELREKLLASLEAEYKKRVGDQEKLLTVLNFYDVKYVFWDKNRFPEWDIGVLKTAKIILEKDGITLFTLNNQ